MSVTSQTSVEKFTSKFPYRIPENFSISFGIDLFCTQLVSNFPRRNPNLVPRRISREIFVSTFHSRLEKSHLKVWIFQFQDYDFENQRRQGIFIPVWHSRHVPRTFVSVREGKVMNLPRIWFTKGKVTPRVVRENRIRRRVCVEIVALNARIKLFRRALQSRPVLGTQSSPDFKCSYQRRRYVPTMVNRDKLQPPATKFASWGEPRPFEPTIANESLSFDKRAISERTVGRFASPMKTTFRMAAFNE